MSGVIGRLWTEGDWDYQLPAACRVSNGMWQEIKKLGDAARHLASMVPVDGTPVAEIGYSGLVHEEVTLLDVDDYNADFDPEHCTEAAYQDLIFQKVVFWPPSTPGAPMPVCIYLEIPFSGISVELHDLPDIEAAT